MKTKQETIYIQPFTQPSDAVVAVPGSKSISNRALILSAMCGGEVELKGLLHSEDVDLMRQALVDLGFGIRKDRKKYIIKGTGGYVGNKECSINVGNAGTIARFLTCFLASQKTGIFSMDGSDAMRKRPMHELLNCLIKLGCKVEYKKENGCFPFILHTNGLNNNKIKIDARKSGQNISGIIMQCPLLQSDCEINFENGTVSVPFIKMTLEMMRSFCENNILDYTFYNNAIKIDKCSYENENFSYNIEPDATAASYFMTLPQVVGGTCVIPGMKEQMLQGDIAYYQVLNKLGANISFDEYGVISRQERSLSGGSFDFVDISDTFLTLAAISPLLNDTLEIYGIEHTRKQETDRVSAMARELVKLGQDVTEKSDRLIIRPNINKLISRAKSGVEVMTYKDHRFAMSFGILGSLDLLGNGQPWLKINDPGCCSKTFPQFFDYLDTARLDSYGKK
jgi:3-phosphoshikimate 1-carboxyvinyltransferase